VLHGTPLRIDAGRENVRRLFRIRRYNELSDRNQALLTVAQKALTLYLGRPIRIEEIMGAVADIGGDMRGEAQ
jgi:hypothetical protein